MSTVATALLSEHILPRPGIDLLQARQVNATWREANSVAWLRFRGPPRSLVHRCCSHPNPNSMSLLLSQLRVSGILWAIHLQNQKYEKAKSQRANSMARMVTAHQVLVHRYLRHHTTARTLRLFFLCRRRPSYSDATGCLFRVEQCLQASPLLHFVSLILGATRADGYTPNSIPIEWLLAPSLLSSLLILAIYTCNRGCYRIAREFGLFQSYKSALSHLQRLHQQQAKSSSERHSTSDDIDLEQDKESLLDFQYAPVPAASRWCTFRGELYTRLGPAFSGLRSHREPNFDGNNPVFKLSITELVFFGITAGVAPALFVVLLWLKIGTGAVNWYVVFSPWVLMCCGAIWISRNLSTREWGPLIIATVICTPLLTTLGFTAARMEGAIDWAYWQCFILVDTLVIALVGFCVLMIFDDQGKQAVFLMNNLLAVAAAIATFPFMLDGFTLVSCIPFTAIASVFGFLPLLSLVFWVFYIHINN